MGATRESPSLTDAAELDELRRRAYGPDADIGDDPAAIERLIELEWEHANAVTPAAFATPALPELPATEAIAPDESLVQQRSDRAAAARSGAPLHRRRAVTSVLVVGAALGFAALGSLLSAGSSGVTLYPRADTPAAVATQLSTLEEVGYLSISPATVTLYDDYRDLRVWTITRGSGTICLVVTGIGSSRLGLDCTPRTGRPTVDLQQYWEESRLEEVEALSEVPEGGALRLTLQDGAVTVSVVGGPPISEAGR